MGKQKRVRTKFHQAVNKQKQENSTNMDTTEADEFLPLSQPDGNVFEGISINFADLKKKLNDDDMKSVKSYKSAKSEMSSNILPKKEKMKLRRQILLKKIDTVNQMKKELKIRDKRKNTAVIGDTNPLHDALPSLESLLSNRKGRTNEKKEPPKKKGIEKASKRKKNVIQGVQMFKKIMKNKDFQKNPLDAISGHVQALVQQQRSLVKK